MASSKRPKWSFLHFLILKYARNLWGGIEFDSPERELVLVTPDLLFFLKGIIIVHEIKISP